LNENQITITSDSF